jgi:CBS domain-containing membrane protein
MATPQPPDDQKISNLIKFRLFSPILAGATFRERVIGCIGALLAICVSGLVCGLFFGNDPYLPLIVAPIGASAVLLFAVPASPLAQPWSIVGGNTISALVGVTVTWFVADATIAIGLAVSLAILVMSLTRSLHPPGGAAALTAVIGGSAVTQAGFWFPLVPVAVNSVLLVAVGILFHRLSGRQYPHRPAPVPVNTHKTADPPPAMRVGFRAEDIDTALTQLNETLDISRDDIHALLREVEQQSLLRQKGELLCADIMSRDVVTATVNTTPAEALAQLLAHDVRTLPVLDGEARLVGTIGLRELATQADMTGRLPLSPAATARPEDPAIGLLPRLTDGMTHAMVVLDGDDRVVGIISQTDLLATLATSLAQAHGGNNMLGSGQGI